MKQICLECFFSRKQRKFRALRIEKKGPARNAARERFSCGPFQLAFLARDSGQQPESERSAAEAAKMAEDRGRQAAKFADEKAREAAKLAEEKAGQAKAAAFF